MHYDVVIIGAGLSGLAAGIRLAYFDRSVCIVEKHYAFGGLNSYYTLDGREFDVGLHALTNYVPPGVRNAPLPKLLRQLRLNRDELDLREQRYSLIRFPHHTLRFTNDIAVMTEEIAREFPAEREGFQRLLANINAYEDLRLDAEWVSTRETLSRYLRDPMLIDMLLCPVMYYGSAEERDMDYTQFVILFKSLFCEGFARPHGGVRPLIKALVRKFRGNGGKLRMRDGVKRIEVEDGRAAALQLESGDTLTADMVFSCAGYPETMRLCSDRQSDEKPESGRLSFVESMAVMDTLPDKLGHEATIVFFNDTDKFTYACPDEPIDPRSGVLCCPTNYEGQDESAEGLFRVTWLANYDRWRALDDGAYAETKRAYLPAVMEQGERLMPGFEKNVVYTDMFTPKTIQRYTGHLGGAVYGSPNKRRDGRTDIANLFICGTDQGFLGIIGAMLSGITMANLHVLAAD